MDQGAESYRRFIKGDDGAIADIVAEYKDGLILFLLGIVNDIHTAEDLAEDTFFRLMVKKPRFSGGSSFRTWLYAIGRNIAVDYIRHRSAGAGTTYAKTTRQTEELEDLERVYIRKEGRIAVHRAMEKLPSDYRQVIWLVYFEEMTNPDAAIIMKKNERQIRNLLYRAKQSLKKELEREGIDGENY